MCAGTGVSQTLKFDALRLIALFAVAYKVLATYLEQFGFLIDDFNNARKAVQMGGHTVI